MEAETPLLSHDAPRVAVALHGWVRHHLWARRQQRDGVIRDRWQRRSGRRRRRRDGRRCCCLHGRGWCGVGDVPEGEQVHDARGNDGEVDGLVGPLEVGVHEEVAECAGDACDAGAGAPGACEEGVEVAEVAEDDGLAHGRVAADEEDGEDGEAEVDEGGQGEHGQAGHAGDGSDVDAEGGGRLQQVDGVGQLYAATQQHRRPLDDADQRQRVEGRGQREGGRQHDDEVEVVDDA